MSENTLRPIWTPDDYQQTVRDAAAHHNQPAITAETMEPDVLPAQAHGRPTTDQPCPSCWAWFDEPCEPGCIQQMTPEHADRYRAEVLHRTLSELGIDATFDGEAAPLTVTSCTRRGRGRHRAPTVLGMRPHNARRVAKLAIAVAVAVLVLAAGALWASSDADADPDPYPYGVECVDDFWLILFQSTRRTICDGPIAPDGSWTRLREFYTPAYNVPLRTTCSGSYVVSCTTTGGYFQPRTSRGVESYPVTAATVLHDEPGHIA